ncbi:MAG: cytochrome c3 family protein [Nitrospirae bacterium]|nr:cytochrome c3 family protein [Nitrospirota bacterium]
MRRKSVPLAILLLSGIALAAVYSMEKEPHKFPQSKCPSCHAMDLQGRVVKGQMAAPVSLSCRECHEDVFEEGYMHPVDVSPQNVRIPADMPLSNYGHVTCSTCHDIHSPYLTPYGAPSRYLRRYETGRKFCDVCHKGMMKGHKGTLGEAHFRSKYIVTSPSQEIDSTSKNCISCHDGSFSQSATIKAGTWTHGKDFIQHDMGSHPIGIDYESARVTRGRKTDLKPMGMVDRRIRFFNGKIGCGSCHDPYSSLKGKLVMSDEQSRLCLACHMIDKR